MPGTIHGWITCTRPAACRPSHPRTKAKPTRPPGASANHRSPIFSTELPSPLAHCGRLPGARAYSYTSPAGRSIHSLICLDSRVTLPPSQMPVAWLLSKTDTWDSCRCGRYSPGCYACHGEPAPGKVTIAPGVRPGPRLLYSTPRRESEAPAPRPAACRGRRSASASGPAKEHRSWPAATVADREVAAGHGGGWAPRASRERHLVYSVLGQVTFLLVAAGPSGAAGPSVAHGSATDGLMIWTGAVIA